MEWSTHTACSVAARSELFPLARTSMFAGPVRASPLLSQEDLDPCAEAAELLVKTTRMFSTMRPVSMQPHPTAWAAKKMQYLQSSTCPVSLKVLGVLMKAEQPGVRVLPSSCLATAMSPRRMMYRTWKIYRSCECARTLVSTGPQLGRAERLCQVVPTAQNSGLTEMASVYALSLD
jgi:hypothetical protein